MGVYCGRTLCEEGNGPGRRRGPLKVTLNQTDGRLTDPAVPHRPPRRVLSELPGSERGARSVCPLEAGVDCGCDGTFVERVAVLWENIANCKGNVRLSPLPTSARPT